MAEFATGATVGLTAQQHLLGNYGIALDGDRATASTYVHATQIQGEEAGGGVLVTGGIYRDALVRTDDGWRITERDMQSLWREQRALSA